MRKLQQISVNVFLSKKCDATFLLRNFLKKERIRISCLQRYHKTLQENTKVTGTEHERKHEKEAGQRTASYIIEKEEEVWEVDLTRFKRTNF